MLELSLFIARSESFPSNALFMCFGLQRFCSLSRRLMRFHNTAKHCFELFFMGIFLLYICSHDARMLFVSLAKHGWSHRSFQFSSCVVDNFWIPAFLDSERLCQFSSKLLATHNLVCESLSVSPRTTCILLECSLSLEWTPLQESDKYLSMFNPTRRFVIPKPGPNVFTENKG